MSGRDFRQFFRVFIQDLFLLQKSAALLDDADSLCRAVTQFYTHNKKSFPIACWTSTQSIRCDVAHDYWAQYDIRPGSWSQVDFFAEETISEVALKLFDQS